MKKIISSVLVVVFVLSSCSNLPTLDGTNTPGATSQRIQLPATQIPLGYLGTEEENTRQSKTLSPTTHPTRTYTPTPSNTPTLTAIPTFHAEGLITITPLPTAVCPTANANFQIPPEIFNEPVEKDLNETIKSLLESGASFEQIVKAFDRELPWWGDVIAADLTGDGVDELVLPQWMGLDVYGCDEGHYENMLDYFSGGGMGTPDFFVTEDMNLNGMPEVIVRFELSTGYNTNVDILEWNGKEFKSLIRSNLGAESPSTSPLAKALYWYGKDGMDWHGPESDTWIASLGNIPEMNGPARIKVQDLDSNGTKELIIKDSGLSNWDTIYNFGPWRGKQVIFSWDGIHFLYTTLIMDPPIYRFQAVQDADRYFLLGYYDQALKLYQGVIFDDHLGWWSAAKMQNIEDIALAINAQERLPTQLPPDRNEYYFLAAYTRYRIMLHHLARGWISDAEVVYKTLQQKFPPGKPGHEFAIMAEILWVNYQTNGSLELSCQPVIEFVQGNTAMLAPLGDLEHGLQSHIYVPEDVCPFPPIGN